MLQELHRSRHVATWWGGGGARAPQNFQDRLNFFQTPFLTSIDYMYVPPPPPPPKHQTLATGLHRSMSKINRSKNYVIIGGDFNLIINYECDYNGKLQQSPQIRFSKEASDFMKKIDLIEIWRERNPLKKQFSFTKDNTFMQSRLDHWLISEDLVITCGIIFS